MLPDENAPWPPAAIKPVYRQVGRLIDWYSDDVPALYPETQGNLTTQSVGTWFDRATNRTRRAVAPSANSIGRLHVPMAADIARTSADLLFAELPEIEAPDTATQDRLDELAGKLRLESKLVEMAELCAALTGIYWRLNFDPRVIRDRPILSRVTPDRAVPEWAWETLRAVTFWDELEQPPTGPEGTWRHLERYSLEMTPGGQTVSVIEHGLYVGASDSLGRRMALTDHPSTEGITVMDGDRIYPGTTRLLAGYIPNMCPNREFLNVPMGRADIYGLDQPDGVLAALDKAWSSWMRDLDLGKAKLFVPEEYLRDLGPGAGAVYDVDRSIYAPLKVPFSDSGNNGMLAFQPAIRFAEHDQTTMRLMVQAVQGAGYSPASFGLAAGDAPAQTATEVRQKNAESMTTREKKSRYWSAAMREELLPALLELDSVMFGGKGDPDAELSIEFPEAVAEDPHRKAETVALWFQAQAASTAERVRYVHPDWDETQVTEEVTLIDNANAIVAPAPLDDGEADPASGLPQSAPTDANFA